LKQIPAWLSFKTDFYIGDEVMETQDLIYGINGPVVTVRNSRSFSMMEMVFVGNERLVGEVIGVSDKVTTIQVYEETTGLRPGEPVYGTGSPMNVTLGPGLLDNIFDGIERPLKEIAKQKGPFISRGSNVPSLDETREWDVTVTVKVGDQLQGGDLYAQCPETPAILHKCQVRPSLSGTVTKVVPNGKYHVNDTLVELTDASGKVHKLSLAQKWPIRTPRPVSEHLQPTVPLITGQRIIDTLFPISKGGTAAIPGGFGTGKTVLQHQLAKWCDADIIIYVGCGERGNEMSQVLDEFTELIDPKSGRPLTDRTVLIANTSNMPVAAREASIYTGITLAEYYRDMGYNVAMMADSTSRWAEALREISGRLEEMPAEEGFPAYLPSRLAEFYERAGMTKNLNGTVGSVTIIGAVSPQGSDFSEPVTQNTKRFTRCFWALDKSLAYARHYPAINWMQSYSEYFTDLDPWFLKNEGKDFIQYRKQINVILQQENKLMEIVKLIGSDVLPDDQKLTIQIAAVIRIGFLQQNALSSFDSYVPLEKQKLMMKVILHLYKKSKELLSAGIPISSITQTGLFDKLNRMKNEIPNDKLEIFDEYMSDIDKTLAGIVSA
jgi:V/A-type H+-transporting ATPase subunit A